MQTLKPKTLAADNSYAKASRFRRWAKQGVVLTTPACKWRTGRFAQAYQCYRNQPTNARRLRQHRTTKSVLGRAAMRFFENLAHRRMRNLVAILEFDSVLDQQA